MATISERDVWFVINALHMYASEVCDRDAEDSNAESLKESSATKRTMYRRMARQFKEEGKRARTIADKLEQAEGN